MKSDEYDGPWELACAENDFVSWRESESFRALVTLARAVNAVRFAGYALKPVATEDSIAAKRQRLNSFIYVGALLYEVTLFLRKYRGQLEQYPAFGPLAAAMLDQPETTSFIDDKLHSGIEPSFISTLISSRGRWAQPRAPPSSSVEVTRSRQVTPTTTWLIVLL